MSAPPEYRKDGGSGRETALREGITSLDRALRIIEALARTEQMSLAELHAATGIPKPTVLRLLETLIARRYVRRSQVDGKYRTLVSLPQRDTPVAQAALLARLDPALPTLIQLTRHAGWPIDVHLREAAAMRLVESTRPFSPFQVLRTRGSERVSLFGSAAGLALLSTLDEPALRALYDDPGLLPLWRPERFQLDWERLTRLIARVRQQGYATRIAAYSGERLIDDNMRAIGLPFRDRCRYIGAVCMLWPRSFQSETTFAASNLTTLQRAVAVIEHQLSEG